MILAIPQGLPTENNSLKTCSKCRSTILLEYFSKNRKGDYCKCCDNCKRNKKIKEVKEGGGAKVDIIPQRDDIDKYTFAPHEVYLKILNHITSGNILNEKENIKHKGFLSQVAKQFR